MKRDIKDFITFKKMKNGKLILRFTPANKANIHKLLLEEGFACVKMGERYIFFQRKDGTLKRILFEEIRDFVTEFMETHEFTGMPEYMTRADIMRCYYNNPPFYRVKLYSYLLVDSDETIEHELKLILDVNYKHNLKMEETKKMFEEWGLKKAVNKTEEFTPDCNIYYKGTKGKEYLLFTHYERENRNTFAGFNCRLAQYASEKGIGKKAPEKFEEIKADFLYPEDYDLVKKYIK